MADSQFFLLGVSLLLPGFFKQLALAAIIGLFIGVERELRHKIASLRTFSFICAGSCLFTLLSIHGALIAGALPGDATRIASNIVTGIGFLGGGVIFKTQNRVEGISTGSMIWFASAIGMACGFNQIGIALCSVVIYFAILIVALLLHRLLRRVQPDLNHQDDGIGRSILADEHTSPGSD